MSFSSMGTHLFLLFVSLLLIPLHAVSSSGAGFSLVLIHRDSPKSPLYDPSSTPFQRAMAAAQRSKLAVRSGSTIFPNSIQGSIIPAVGEYLMSYEVGSIPFEVYGVFSVGSDFTWTNCKPCNHCSQAVPLFDPSKSATYQNVSCESDACKHLPTSFDCAGDGTCQYHYGSVDGFLATETIYLPQTEGGVVTLPAFPFGCAYRTSGTFQGRTSGVVGLNQGPNTWITHLRLTIGVSKFSYCLPPFSKPEKIAKLNFGDAAVYPAGAATTPLIGNVASYVVNLMEVVVGGKSIMVPMSTVGNMALDSRTPLSFLSPPVLEQVVAAVADLVSLPRSSNSSYLLFGICYEDMGQPDGRYPGMEFKFNEGATLRLTPSNAFTKPSAEVVCLAMSRASDMQFLGTIAQQNNVVVYDVGEQKIAFAPADCTTA